MLETARLILRQPTADDFESLAAMFGEASVTRHIGGVLSRADAWARFLRDYGHWSLTGFGQFTIIEKVSGLYVGKTGFAKFERDLGPNAGTSVECSWVLRPAFQGIGYAREAALAAQTWFDERIGGPTACLIGEANTPSRKLATFLGYVEVDRLVRQTGPYAVLRRDAAS